ncbi:MAG: UbiH/UbiF/VisC/COQ6 family ubiquinone biosynthesis hydroxylase [Alphaproteobacteria bacterium]|nr:UbiH/UbiF/VisC/COQ6 family ubiquinone biosynthesis hydroxylase [Alphaproteobacteria bacterium]
MMSPVKSDVIIIGGGLVGATLAIGLAQKQILVTVIDKERPENQLLPQTDGRTTAVSYGSQQIFNKLGAWNAMAPYAQPIWEIRVFEAGSPWTVDYDHKDLGPNPMGYIVENRILRQALYDCRNIKHLNWIAPNSVKSADYKDQKVTLVLQDDQIIEAPLVVGAEGRFSQMRAQSSICTKTWDYSEHALVTHLTHEKPHNGTAWEIFLPDGPLAILPMLDHENGKSRSGIVWAKSRKHDWADWTDQELALKIEEHFPFYGKLEVCNQRWSYPLSALTVDSIIDHRMVLVGDAAHVVHPIAGQGVNLGWRDADALVKCLVEAKSLGLDIGSYTVLESYQKERRRDHRAVLLMTDGINKLFNNSSSILHFARNAGFAAVNHIKPLKRFLMKKAMGL